MTKPNVITMLLGDGEMRGFRVNEQPYQFQRAGMHQSKITGEVYPVSYYEAECYDCQKPFQVFLKDDHVKVEVLRRCSACARPMKLARKPANRVPPLAEQEAIDGQC